MAIEKVAEWVAGQGPGIARPSVAVDGVCGGGVAGDAGAAGESCAGSARGVAGGEREVSLVPFSLLIAMR